MVSIILMWPPRSLPPKVMYFLPVIQSNTVRNFADVYSHQLVIFNKGTFTQVNPFYQVSPFKGTELFLGKDSEQKGTCHSGISPLQTPKMERVGVIYTS